MAVGQTDAVVAMADGLAKRPRRVLHGLGGVGKTQLAIRFAQEHRSSYDVVWGTRAGSSAQLAASHVELGRILGIVTSQIPIPEAVSTVRRWLAEHDRWLLVFDAAAYLRRRSGRPHDADATELAADLGCLPLALDQAFSHCEASATSFSDCRSMYAEMSARVLARSPVPDDHPDSVPMLN